MLVISLRGAVARSKTFQAGSLAHVNNCVCLTSSELRVLCIATGQSPESGRCACKVRRFTNKTPYKAFSQVKSRNVSPLRHSILRHSIKLAHLQTLPPAADLHIRHHACCPCRDQFTQPSVLVVAALTRGTPAINQSQSCSVSDSDVQSVK